MKVCQVQVIKRFSLLCKFWLLCSPTLGDNLQIQYPIRAELHLSKDWKVIALKAFSALGTADR